jgi:hypothetical protein
VQAQPDANDRWNRIAIVEMMAASEVVLYPRAGEESKSHTSPYRITGTEPAGPLGNGTFVTRDSPGGDARTVTVGGRAMSGLSTPRT